MRPRYFKCLIVVVSLVALFGGSAISLQAQLRSGEGVECEDDIGGGPPWDLELWQPRGAAMPSDTNCFMAPIGPPGGEGWIDHAIAESAAGESFELKYYAENLQLPSPDQFQLVQLCREDVCRAEGRLLTIRLWRDGATNAYRLSFEWRSDTEGGLQTPGFELSDPFRLRVAWHRSTLDSRGPRRDGFLRAWIDDLLVFEEDGLLLRNARPTLARSGACGGVDPGTSGELWIQILETAALY